jgi:hypothetical protein
MGTGLGQHTPCPPEEEASSGWANRIAVDLKDVGQSASAENHVLCPPSRRHHPRPAFFTASPSLIAIADWLR